MDNEERCPTNHFGLLGLEDIRTSPDIISRIKWDVTPQEVMEPRFQSRPEDVERLKDISGNIFYIETACEKPALMLMTVGKSDVTTTVGKIDEIPAELIRKAIEDPVEKPVFGMYAITGEIREWLKGALGLT